MDSMCLEGFSVEIHELELHSSRITKGMKEPLFRFECAAHANQLLGMQSIPADIVKLVIPRYEAWSAK